MFSEKDLITRSIEDMRLEVENLEAESKHLRGEYEESLQKENELRCESVETRPENPELAEMLWLEAERLREEGRELLRCSVEKRMRAADVQHRIDIKAKIEALDEYEAIWKKASAAGRI